MDFWSFRMIVALLGGALLVSLVASPLSAAEHVDTCKKRVRLVEVQRLDGQGLGEGALELKVKAELSPHGGSTVIPQSKYERGQTNQFRDDVAILPIPRDATRHKQTLKTVVTEHEVPEDAMTGGTDRGEETTSLFLSCDTAATFDQKVTVRGPNDAKVRVVYRIEDAPGLEWVDDARSGERNLLVILQDTGRHPTPSKQKIVDALFGEEDPSVARWFEENSGGELTIREAGVLGWYGLDKDPDYYLDKPKHPKERRVEALQDADSDFDFAPYDDNGDGTLTPDELGILIVMPGTGGAGGNRSIGEKVDGLNVKQIAEWFTGFIGGGPEGVHGNAEEVGFVAFGPGQGTTGDIDYEVGRTDDAVTQDWEPLDFARSFGGSPVFVSSIQTFDGNNPIDLRYQNLGSSGVEVRVQEERSEDPETEHDPEVVGYATFGQPGELRDHRGNLIGEFGLLSGSQPRAGQPEQWREQSLDHRYSDPVVIAGPLSENGSHPAHVRIDDVGPNSFKWRIEEWAYLDDHHKDESFGYLVVERGTHTLRDERDDDDREIRAGTVSDVTHEWTLKTLSFDFEPVVLAQTQTYNGTDPVVVRLDKVGAEGFNVRLQEEEWSRENDGVAAGAHELAHLFLGLPDMYVNDSKWTEWQQQGQADNYAMLDSHFDFPFLSEPSRLRLGWLEAKELPYRDGSYTIPAVKSSREVYVLPHPRYPERDEYFVIANRQNGTFYDARLQDTGLIVWHVIEDQQILAELPIHGSWLRKGVRLVRENGGRPSDDSDALWSQGEGPIELGWVDPDKPGRSAPSGVTLTDLTASDDTMHFDVERRWGPFEVGEVVIDGTWTKVVLDRDYDDPVVVAGLPSRNGSDPTTVRIREVHDGSFEIRLQEWDYLEDGGHVQEAVGYVVMESGTWARFDGHILAHGDTRKVSTTGIDDFTPLDFPDDFSRFLSEKPIVLASVVSKEGDDAVTTRIQNVDQSGFEVTLQEQGENPRVGEEGSNPQWHAEEEVAYIALVPGMSTQVGGHLFRTGRTRGVDHGRTTLGGSAAPFEDVEIFVEEERSHDPETQHDDPEQVGYMLVYPADAPESRPITFAEMQTTEGSDPATLRLSEGTFTLEAGSVSVDEAWKRVWLKKEFIDPVVVAGPASDGGGDQVTIRVTNVNDRHFEIRLHEWGYIEEREHTDEMVHYLVVERGEFELPSGATIEAGSVRARGALPSEDAFTPIDFYSLFSSSDPSVFTTVASFRGSDTVVTRNQKVGRAGFEVAMQEQQTKGGHHVEESIHWVAVSPDVDEVRGIDVLKEVQHLTHTPQIVRFDHTFRSEPCFVAAIQTFNGHDTANLRYDQLKTDSVRLRVDEADSEDDGTAHRRGEEVSLLALECSMD